MKRGHSAGARDPYAKVRQATALPAAPPPPPPAAPTSHPAERVIGAGTGISINPVTGVMRFDPRAMDPALLGPPPLIVEISKHLAEAWGYPPETFVSTFMWTRTYEPLERVAGALKRLSPSDPARPARALSALSRCPWDGQGGAKEPRPADRALHILAERGYLSAAYPHLKRALGALMAWRDYSADMKFALPRHLDKAIEAVDLAVGLVGPRLAATDRQLAGTAPRRLGTRTRVDEEEDPRFPWPDPNNPPQAWAWTDKRPQAWALLRSTAVDLARGLAGAKPLPKRRREDKRVKHGRLRAAVLRCTIEIIDALYDVPFKAEDLKSAWRARQ